MDDLSGLLQSRPLVGFQLDGSHLNNVLQAIIRQQQQLASAQAQVHQRLSAMDEDVREIRDHQRELERLVDNLGAQGNSRAHLDAIDAALDQLGKGLDDVQKIAAAAERDADAAGRLADKANRGLLPLQDSVQRLGQDMEAVGKQGVQDRRDMARALDSLEQSRLQQDKRMADALRDVQQVAERQMRDSGVGRLQQMIDELSDRTDENFKNIEQSARAVDAELTRLSSDMTGLRGQIVSLDQLTNERTAAVAAEANDHYRQLFEAFREYERSNTELEEHLAMAGQALAQRRAAPLTRGGSRR